MKHIQQVLLVAATSLLALQGAAFAQPVNGAGWYAGGSVGSSKLKPKIENSSATLTGTQDTSDTGYKLLGGYQIDNNWAIEGQYQNLGKWHYSEPGLTGSAKVSGLSVSAVGMLPVGNNVTLLGKLGLVRQTFKATAVDTITQDSASRKLNKTTPLIGLGAEYNFTPAMALRAEYEFFGTPTLLSGGNEKLKAHTALLSVGLRYRF